VMVRMIDGELKRGMRIRLWEQGTEHNIDDIGVLTPKPRPIDKLVAGEVGFFVANIKTVADVSIGDTVTEASRPTAEPFPGFQEIKPMVFAGLYPTDSHAYEELRDALAKLRLNDSSFFYEPEVSLALGFGFRCGFLGLLHMEIVQERLEREFNIDLITTAPSVRYRVTTTKGEVIEIDNPSKLPDPGQISKIEEPIIKAMIMTSDEFVGNILTLLDEKRGIQKGFEYITPTRLLLTYNVPLNEIVMDFYDRLKSISKGYA
jgi:GTP-binding protein LepA